MTRRRGSIEAISSPKTSCKRSSSSRSSGSKGGIIAGGNTGSRFRHLASANRDGAVDSHAKRQWGMADGGSFQEEMAFAQRNTTDRLSAWCEERLGSTVAEVLFTVQCL